MANVSIKFKARGDWAKNLREVVEETIGIKIRNNFGDFRPLISNAITDSVRRISRDLIPTDEEAAELGIGEIGEGRINIEKTETAWKQLLPGNGYVTFSVRKSGSKSNKTVGFASFNIDRKGFLEAPLSIVQIDGGVIPWMEWFIYGAYLGEFTFIGPSAKNTETIRKFSRTGRGIMTFGGEWDFPAQGLGIFEYLNDTIIDEISKTIEANLGDII